MDGTKKLGFLSLTALVIGSMIGGGVFQLPTDLAAGAHSGAILLGWFITGIGMISLALVYQNLAKRKPELEGGIYSYARAGFGELIGFQSAWGYWISAWLGNVAYATLLFSAMSYFFPVFGKGNNLVSIVGASILLWMIHALVLRGVRQASFVNLITTFAKLVPIVLFLIFIALAFQVDRFTLDFWGEGSFDWSSVQSQVKSTMLVTLWVFIGVEGAVVLSGRAKDKKDVGRATVVGLLATLLIYILISILSLGVMSQSQLAQLESPSMAYVLEEVVGTWGAVVINLGLVISLLGALLGWTLLAAEIPYVAAKDGIFPKWLAKENQSGSPSGSLWLTNGLVQVFLLVILFAESTYQTLYSMATVMILLPYLFSALYQLKLAWKGEGFSVKERSSQLIISVIASCYAVWLVYAAGVTYLLLSAILFASGLLLYFWARKEQNADRMKPWEVGIACVLVLFAIVAVFLMLQGKVSP